MSEQKPNGIRAMTAIVAAVVSALAGTGAGVATHRLDPSSHTDDLERRISTVEGRLHAAEVQSAAFSATVNQKLQTLIDRVGALDAKLDRLTERRR